MWWRRPAPGGRARDGGFQKQTVLLPSWPSRSACDRLAWKWMDAAKTQDILPAPERNIQIFQSRN